VPKHVFQTSVSPNTIFKTTVIFFLNERAEVKQRGKEKPP
jgi:hypothetical protein